MASGEYTDSPFADAEVGEASRRRELEKGISFVQEHNRKLRDIETAICASNDKLFDTHEDPINLFLQPPERVDVADLIKTDNELFDKVMTVLAVLCDEITELKNAAELNFYPSLLMFGQQPFGKEDELMEGDREILFGRKCVLFQDISNFVDRCNAITSNLIQQMASLYSNIQKLWRATFKHVHLIPVFEALGELLEVLVTLDSIVSDNHHITEAWESYRDMMPYVRADMGRYNIEEKKLKQFERLLVGLDQTIMKSQLLLQCVDQEFEEASPTSKVDVRHNKIFLEEFFFCIKELFDRAQKGIGSPTETNERMQILRVFALYVLYRKLNPPNVRPDADFYKKMWKVQNKVPVVILCGKACWYPSEFLNANAPFPTKNLDPKDPPAARRAYLNKLDDGFGDKMEKLYAQTCMWLVRVESVFQSSCNESAQRSQKLLLKQCTFIKKGLFLASEIRNNIEMCLNLHLSGGKSLTTSIVKGLARCGEMLKAIEFMFAKKGPVLAESMVHITRQSAQTIVQVFTPVKAKLESSKKLEDIRIDMLAAIRIIESVLTNTESVSSTRRLVISLSYPAILIKGSSLKEEQADRAVAELQTLNWISDIQTKISNICNCSFLYWSAGDILPTLLDMMYNSPQTSSQARYLMAAYQDCASMLAVARQLDDEDETVFNIAYKDFLMQSVEDTLIKPLCIGIGQDLRYQIHTRLKGGELDTLNPLASKTKQLGDLLNMKPLNIYSDRVDLKQRVAFYLEEDFYNLTTVALSDFEKYVEMRNLAFEKYGLVLQDNHLPMGSINTGLDVLQIMRNINIFVSRFNYNLNQQEFIERRVESGGKHLNTINYMSISSSIRTHGMGIMSTTVNLTYNFLGKKFTVFNKFLNDEYIKSSLDKELRWCNKNLKKAGNNYPYVQAENLYKNIRKLGVREGMTYLDHFRVLISEIGNALGYVRMVRSAGMHYCSNAIRFLPDLEDIKQFQHFAGAGYTAPEDSDEYDIEGSKLSEDTIRAAKNLDLAVKNLEEKFSNTINYFNLMVENFRQTMQQFGYLKIFHMIIPAMTINFVEKSILAKESMNKHNRGKLAYFTDDGFAIGVAYVLAILNQGDDFDSLHWFDTINEKLKNDEADLKKQRDAQEAKMKAKKDKKGKEEEFNLDEDEGAVHTLQLTYKRLQMTRKEYELLFFSLSGARIFFKESDEYVDLKGRNQKDNAPEDSAPN